MLGVIEIENPVLITCKKYSGKYIKEIFGRKYVYKPKRAGTYTNYFVTTKANVPYVLKNKKNIDNLIYDTNYYVLHLSAFNQFMETFEVVFQELVGWGN